MLNRISRFITAAVLAFPTITALRAEEGAVEVLDRMDSVIDRLEYLQADFYQRSVALTEILSLIDSLDRVSRTDVEKLFQDETAMAREVLREGQSAMPQMLKLTVDSLRAQVEAARVWLGLLNANARFRRGDIDSNGVRDISDVINLLGYLFREEEAPTCLKTADVNDDGQVDISDTIGLLFHLFLSDREMAPPGACGTDPTSDPIPCEDYAGC